MGCSPSKAEQAAIADVPSSRHCIPYMNKHQYGIIARNQTHNDTELWQRFGDWLKNPYRYDQKTELQRSRELERGFVHFPNRTSNGGSSAGKAKYGGATGWNDVNRWKYTIQWRDDKGKDYPSGLKRDLLEGSLRQKDLAAKSVREGTDLSQALDAYMFEAVSTNRKNQPVSGMYYVTLEKFRQWKRNTKFRDLHAMDKTQFANDGTFGGKDLTVFDWPFHFMKGNHTQNWYVFYRDNEEGTKCRYVKIDEKEYFAKFLSQKLDKIETPGRRRMAHLKCMLPSPDA